MLREAESRRRLAVERLILPIVGIVIFLALWQGIIVVTRPDPVGRPTLGLSAERGGRIGAAVIGSRGDVLFHEALLPATARAQLPLWLTSWRPTLVAVSPGSDTAWITEAQRQVGGGLDVQGIAIAGSAGPADEALARARQLQETRRVRPAWLPDPVETAQAFGQMTVSGEMVRHVIASLFRVATGFVLAAVLGIPFGVALGSFARLSLLTNAVIQGLRPISPIAWLPAATLALGGGDLAAVFLIFLAAFLPIAVATASAVAGVDRKYRRSAQNFGVTGLAMARRVVLPAALPAILTALRLALGIAWVVVVAAEMLGVESGLGYLVLDARNQLRYDRVVAAMVAIGLIGLGLDTLMRQVERGELDRRGLNRR